MKMKNTMIATALSLALVGNANAGVKDWLKDKKEMIQQQTQGQSQAQATTLPGVQVKGELPPPKPDKGKAMEVAGKGCAIGGLLGGMLGVNPTIGCAVGGAVGYGWSYKKQIKDARGVEAAAKAAGMNATVQTTQTTDEKGKKQEALSALVISYEAADMEAMDEKTTAMLDKLAGLTGKAKNVLTVRFEGVKACQIPLMELNKRQALANHKVENGCGKGENKIIVSPMPDVR